MVTWIADEWISVAEAAQMSHLTERRIQQLAHEGLLTCRRLGVARRSPLLISQQSVQQYMAGNQYRAGERALAL